MPKKYDVRTIKLQDICENEALMRAEEINKDHVLDLIEAIKSKEKVDKIKVFEVDDPKNPEYNGKIFVVDGHHRRRAFINLDFSEIVCEYTKGTWSECLLEAAAANIKNVALKRTRADKQKAVRIYLAISPELSNRAIAEAIKVSDVMVASVRKKMEDEGTIGVSDSIVSKDGSKRTRKPRKEKENSESNGKSTTDKAKVAEDHVKLTTVEECLKKVSHLLGSVRRALDKVVEIDASLGGNTIYDKIVQHCDQAIDLSDDLYVFVKNDNGESGEGDDANLLETAAAE